MIFVSPVGCDVFGCLRVTFNSLTFLIFIAIFSALYPFTAGRSRLWLILVASCIFYGWWDWRFLLLIGFSTTLDYWLGWFLGHTDDPRRRRLLLCTSLVANLGVLAFFKYFGFFVNSFVALADSISWHVSPPLLHIILPVGISFYTFQSMSYTIDVYQRIMPSERSFVRYACFVTFFPQLVAGPIVRADYLLPQLHRDHPLRWESFLSGVQLILWGYVLKSVVADSLAPVVDNHFAAPALSTSLGMLIAVIFYAFQIYGDFAGYSLIAIGIAEIFGYDLGRNFDRPYFAQSFSEFWQRWHISLSTWLRDYLYIPLGGNRGGAWRTYRNLIITMLLGGLWHGANWTFVIWGALHGLYLVLQRLSGVMFPRLTAFFSRSELPFQVLRIACVFSLTCLAWVFFRAQTLNDALVVLQRIFVFDGLGFSAVPFKFEVVKGLALVSALVTCEALSFHFQARPFFARHPRLMGLANACVMWLIALFGTFTGNSFIYFQF